jgi:hypothetical protein
MTVKLLFACAAALAVLTVSCTTLMPVAQSRLANAQDLPLRDTVAAAFSKPALDPAVRAEMIELQASALLNCIAADGAASQPDPSSAPTDASTYGALYERLHAQPDMQRALALMQAAEHACASGAPRRVVQLQRAAYALDRQIDAARGARATPTDRDNITGD